MPTRWRLLIASGIDPAQAVRVNRIARGHPLALTLAAITLRSIDDPGLEELAFHRMIDELARRHLAEIGDPVTRRAVEAAAVVRSVTTPLLGAMLPDVAPSDAYERLRALPLMRPARDGLQLHDTVRDAIARQLRASNPQLYLTLRRACWSRLIRELRTAPASELWRYSADVLYLLENPDVREAFFPSGAQRYAVEPARAADEAPILAIAEHYDGAAGVRATAALWERRPDDFKVVRERDGVVAGYYVLFEAAHLDTSSTADDPVLAQWAAHLADNPVADGERVLFLRRWLSRADGEAPCPVQGAMLARYQGCLYGIPAASAARLSDAPRCRAVRQGRIAAWVRRPRRVRDHDRPVSRIPLPCSISVPVPSTAGSQRSWPPSSVSPRAVSSMSARVSSSSARAARR